MTVAHGPGTFHRCSGRKRSFPFTLRDTLLRAAAAGFYQARWSAEILDEATRNLVATGTMTEEKATRLRSTLERVFPEALVTGYAPFVAAT